MNLDFLIAKAGLRVAEVDVTITGVRLAKGASSLQAQSAEQVTGTMTLSLADLTAAFARPEVVDQLVAGVSGIARPELHLADGDDGGVRLIGSVELMGRRFPVSAATALRIERDRVVVRMGRIEGVPLIGMLSAPLPSFDLPLTLPAGLRFTDVTTRPGGIVLHFAGEDVWLSDAPRPVGTVDAGS
ncbi:DUF2993 domain-containing protein [Jatrophihabitans endophyticus]|uniref:LmeA family phospholipid-binding protein n=1 Tax=Jatrophihabitans endophyticus TaxID=1206085 RepID=UPI0019DDC0EF|nr:DUF2993 domain-containing protein [Jatrophihabitans endophyticus]MBE7188586.1 DUF2993 domain-containing protein [Jatrophihabitans endophyticus]